MELIKFESTELQGIEKSKADHIRSTFLPMAEKIKEFEEDFNEILKLSNVEITEELTKKAKRLRLDISKIRIETDKIRKSEKEEYLRAGKAIDGVSNIVKWAVSDKEQKLKAIEDHFEILENQKLEILQRDREELLSKYIDDAHERTLNTMDDDVWKAYLEAKKKDYNDRIEAEKKAKEESERKEQELAKERKRIEEENKRLKKEAEERERLKKIEDEKRAKEEKIQKEKLEAERKLQEEKRKKERLELEAKIKAERLEKEKIQKEAEEKRLKLQAELKAKEQAELKLKLDAEKKIQDELKKGDKQKVQDLIMDLNDIKTKYTFKAKKNKKMYTDVSVLIDKVINHINS